MDHIPDAQPLLIALGRNTLRLTYLITIRSMMTVPLLTVTGPEMIESEDGPL